MKRFLLDKLDIMLPPDMQRLCEGAEVYDSSCSPEARVYFIDRDGGFFLKTAARGELKAEAEMTAYFNKKGIGARVLGYESDGERDFLLTGRVSGEDCMHEAFMAEPERLCDTIALLLRELHETDASDCPIKDRMSGYVALAEENYRTGNYSREHFPDNFGYRTAEEAHGVLQDGKHALKNEVLIHGDYCLPNIMLDNWRFSGFIDLGLGGIGDRHVDLFWGAWSLGFNLGTDNYRERFFDAYGRDKVDSELLKVVAAAEVFR